jgi:hypothetical protein
MCIKRKKEMDVIKLHELCMQIVTAIVVVT